MTTLYVSDLDGTLLRNDATLSEFSRDTLNRLMDGGLAFTVASARSVYSIRTVLAGLRLRLPVIEFNGAFVTDLATLEHRTISAMPPELPEALYAAIVERGCVALVQTFDGHRDRLYYNTLANEGMEGYIRNRTQARDPRLSHVSDVRQAFGDRVVCFTLIERRETLTPIVEWLERTYGGTFRVHFFEDTYTPGWWWATVHDRRASKDQAVERVAELCGIGDNDNDVAMFRAAGRAVAVANATKRLKACATETIGSNEEDSVVRYILHRKDRPRRPKKRTNEHE
jgi:hydroxymethylpyrimidine pyrophosphatase-like HAD family hydrolase